MNKHLKNMKIFLVMMLEYLSLLSATGLTYCANGPDAGDHVAVMQRISVPGWS
jgi:hypothetical protein